MTRDVKKEFITITFGSVTIKTERPSPEEIKKNILNGQMAFARAIEAFKTKGVKLNATRGAALYQANPKNPKYLLRNIDGNIDQGVLENNKFKVIQSSE
jgi:hypothetical protein